MLASSFLTATEVAIRLRTTPIAILEACRDGRLRATKPGRSWLITEEAVEEYLAASSNTQSVA